MIDEAFSFGGLPFAIQKSNLVLPPVICPQSHYQHANLMDKWVLRSRLQVEYNISHSRFTPYAYAELFNSMNDGMALDKLRLSIGSEYKINKKNSLKIGYIFNSSNDDDEPKGHILGISYTFKF